MYLAGGAIALLCYFINAFALESFAVDFGFYTRYIGPLVEETLKASVIVYLFRSNRVGFLIDAGILGFTVGAGFSFIENLYYLNAAQDAHYGVWVVRGFGTAIMHGGATALFAIIAETLTERHLKMNPLLYLPGLIVAFLLHSVFNHFPISPILSTAVTLRSCRPSCSCCSNATRPPSTTSSNDFAHRRLLKQIQHGEFSGCEAGRFLADMQSKLAGPVAREMVRYFVLHPSWCSIRRILLGRSTGSTSAAG